MKSTFVAALAAFFLTTTLTTAGTIGTTATATVTRSPATVRPKRPAVVKMTPATAKCQRVFVSGLPLTKPVQIVVVVKDVHKWLRRALVACNPKILKIDFLAGGTDKSVPMKVVYAAGETNFWVPSDRRKTIMVTFRHDAWGGRAYWETPPFGFNSEVAFFATKPPGD